VCKICSNVFPTYEYVTKEYYLLESMHSYGGDNDDWSGSFERARKNAKRSRRQAKPFSTLLTTPFLASRAALPQIQSSHSTPQRYHSSLESI
jgi:hypothetical protein